MHSTAVELKQHKVYNDNCSLAQKERHLIRLLYSMVLFLSLRAHTQYQAAKSNRPMSKCWNELLRH